MSGRRADLVLLAAWLLLSAGVVTVAAPRVGLPGLYYDEAFFGQQAKDFFEPERAPDHAASTREVRLFGRPFPLRNAVYLGSLKSQLLLPGFALFGTSVPVLRLSTLAVSLLALLCLMLWTARILEPAAGLLLGLLVAADPSWWFFSLYEWGPFTSLLLCRAAGFLLVTSGWRSQSWLLTAAGGLLLGLGIYSRADFVLILAGAGASLLACRPGLAREALRERRGLLVALVVSLGLAAAPTLVSLPDLLATSGSPALARRGDLAEKLRVVWSLADGSRFHRILEAGGRFDRMFEAPAPAGAFGWAVLAAALVVAARRLGRRGRAGFDAPLFFLLAGVLVSAAMLALPGAVRAHHLLNAFPFFHLLVVAVALELWRWAAGRELRGVALRTALALVLAVLLLGDARVIARTYALAERTGGRGWWTAAIAGPAAELEAAPEARGVSLDWGLHEPLLFLTRRARLVQPIWEIGEAVRSRGAWRLAGGPGDLYLVHDEDYDLFGYGPRFLAAARRLAEREPEAVTIRAHRDRDGRIALWSVRLARAHELRYRQLFQILLADEADPEAGAPSR